MARKRFRPWNPDQMVLFPPAMRDALDEGHIVFRIMDVVETLDIACITDPDSRIMKRGGSYLQGYNCQIVVDEANQITLAEAVTNQAPDQEHLIPMIQRVLHNLGQSPVRLSADTGYMSVDNADHCADNGIDAYLAVGREKHGKTDEEEEAQRDTQAWRTMREKLQTDEGSEIYRRRKVIVEPVFGHVKEARRFRRFSLRGLSKVRAEWTLVCLCGNLLKLVNSEGQVACTLA